MSIDAQLFELEEQFWTGDESYYRRQLTPDAVMVFPPPVGVLDREAILTSLKGVPRWGEVRLTERRLLQPNSDMAVLIYYAEAQRDGESDIYRAYCSSVYVGGDTWRMLTHQQTPAPASDA